LTNTFVARPDIIRSQLSSSLILTTYLREICLNNIPQYPSLACKWPFPKMASHNRSVYASKSYRIFSRVGFISLPFWNRRRTIYYAPTQRRKTHLLHAGYQEAQQLSAICRHRPTPLSRRTCQHTVPTTTHLTTSTCSACGCNTGSKRTGVTTYR
jgi:hypothetical protein